jgi:hypothetical protein
MYSSLILGFVALVLIAVGVMTIFAWLPISKNVFLDGTALPLKLSSDGLTLTLPTPAANPPKYTQDNIDKWRGSYDFWKTIVFWTNVGAAGLGFLVLVGLGVSATHKRSEVMSFEPGAAAPPMNFS